MSLDNNYASGSTSRTGTVTKKSQGAYTVRSGEQSLACAISSRLRKVLVYPIAAPTSLPHRVQAVKEIHPVDPVAVGDEVRFTEAGDGTGLIIEVLPRRNQLTRAAAGPKPLEQVIVANVDQVLAMMAVAEPAPKWPLLDRYLAAAELAGIPALICLTKADLLDEPEAAEAILQATLDYQRLGYPVALVSAATGAGLADLRGWLTGKMSVIIGKSGVGKTTLLNALQPGLGLRVKAISQSTGKGKHATTHVEMFDLDSGGRIVDTPGMREFGLNQISDDDLAYGFVEMRPFLGACKFGLDCSHTHEPGCAIKAAVEAGHIARRRYDSFLRMREA